MNEFAVRDGKSVFKGFNFAIGTGRSSHVAKFNCLQATTFYLVSVSLYFMKVSVNSEVGCGNSKRGFWIYVYACQGFRWKLVLVAIVW